MMRHKLSFRKIHFIYLVLLLFCFIAVLPTSAQDKKPRKTQPQLTTSSIAVGAFVGENPPTAAIINDFETLAQHPLDSVSWYQGFGTTTSNQPNFPSTALDTAVDNRSVQLTLEPWVSLSDISIGKYDHYLKQYATDVKNWNKPLYLRFAHEMIQDNRYDNCQGQTDCSEWYPWQDQPKRYVAAFRHVHNIFQQVDADNVQFVWCPNSTPSDFTTVKKYYPGAQYVDWLCTDGYNWSNNDNQPTQWFGDIFYNIYHTFIDHSAFFGSKPVMIGELSSCDDSSGQAKSAWITDVFNQLGSSNYSQIQAFYWFNMNKECDWRINSSPASLNAFQQALLN